MRKVLAIKVGKLNSAIFLTKTFITYLDIHANKKSGQFSKGFKLRKY